MIYLYIYLSGLFITSVIGTIALWKSGCEDDFIPTIIFVLIWPLTLIGGIYIFFEEGVFPHMFSWWAKRIESRNYKNSMEYKVELVRKGNKL